MGSQRLPMVFWEFKDQDCSLMMSVMERSVAAHLSGLNADALATYL